MPITRQTQKYTHEQIFGLLNLEAFAGIVEYVAPAMNPFEFNINETKPYVCMATYSNLEKKNAWKLYRNAMRLRKESGHGYRKIARKLNKENDVCISENTVAGWIYYGNVPFNGEKTWFKPKPIMPKNRLKRLYLKNGMSASEIGKKNRTTFATVKKWLNKYKIKTRSHRDSMNTAKIRVLFRNQQLTRLQKPHKRLSNEKAYVLGVLCGDGHINKKFIRFEIRHTEEFIREFRNCINKIYGTKYNYKYYKPRNSFVMQINSELMCKDLLGFGKFDTFQWEIPKQVVKSRARNVKRMFLRGLFDSEGSAGYYKVEMSSANGKGVKQAKSMLKSLQIESKIYPTGKYWLLVISRKENLRRFKEEINFTIEKKRSNLANMYGGKW